MSCWGNTDNKRLDPHPSKDLGLQDAAKRALSRTGSWGVPCGRECGRQRSGRGNPVPLYAFTAHNMLKARVIAGLDKNKIAVPLVFSTAECALHTGLGGQMSHHDPGTSAGR